MGTPIPIRPSTPSSGVISSGGLPALRRRAPWGKASHGPKKNSNVILRERSESKDLAATTQDCGTRLLAIVLSVLLAVAMLPAAGLQVGSAFADEPVERPATIGGDVAIEGANDDAAAADDDASAAGDVSTAPVAEEREGGMLAADGLLYGVADGGLALVGFDEAAVPEGALAVPATVSVDGRDVAVVAVDVAEGSVAEGVTALSVPQSVDNIKVDTLASAFPSLLSVEVASGQGSSLPVAAGAAAMRATYSSFGGALLGQATVDVTKEDGAVEAVQCRELVWAPPAMVVARVPVDCLSIASGAFANAKNLKTIVCFGDVQRIATAERDASGNVTQQGALTDEQLETVTVVFPDATPAVPSDADERVSASMALNDGATQTDKRHAWIALEFPLERLSMGKPTGALTETVAVGDDGAISKTDLELISYPGMHPRATDVKHPDESGHIDMAESGLAYTMKSDMTLSVRWQGDVTATPAHLEIPATVSIDGVTYPVTEIGPEAFKGAVFLESVMIPETVTTIATSAFDGCRNLKMDDCLVANLGVAGSSGPREGELVSNVVAEPVGHIEEGIDTSENVAHLEGSAVVDASDRSQSDTSNFLAENVAVDSFGGFRDGLGDTSLTPYTVGTHSIRIASNNTLSKTLTATWNSAALNLGTTNSTTFNSGYSSWFAPTDVYKVDSYAWQVQFGEVSSGVINNKPYYQYNAGYKSLRLVPTDGWEIANVSVAFAGVANSNVFSSWVVTVTTMPRGLSSGVKEVLSKADADAAYAAKSHTHDGRYYTEAEIDTKLSSYVTTTALDAKGYITKSVSDLDNYYAKSDTYAKAEVDSLLAGKANASHVHDDRYYIKSETDSKLEAKLDQAAISKYDTNQKIDDALAVKATNADLAAVGDQVSANAAAIRELDNSAVRMSDFGTISYEGLDSGDKNAYPTSYRKGGMPSIHEPIREGYTFVGWTWSRDAASSDDGNLRSAFSEAGNVTLTAHWAEIVPEANHFFTNETPLRADMASEYQSHVIKVRLADFAGDALSRVAFERNDATGLLRAGSPIELWVGNREDVIGNGTKLVLGDNVEAQLGPLALAQVADESWGIYVGVRIKTADVDASRLVSSYVDGSYAVSLVKMSYEFA